MAASAVDDARDADVDHRQHLRLHRRRQAGVDRRDPRGRAPQGRRRRAGRLRGRVHGGAPQGRAASRRCPRWTSSSARRSPISWCPSCVARGLLGGSLDGASRACALFAGDQPAVRYLKVSEGCDHGCAFCAIPLMRGKHRSFSLDDVVREAQLLELQGARELNLVAQDLAHYGRDRRDGIAPPRAARGAAARDRRSPGSGMLYLYGAGITPRLLEVIAGNPRIVRYLDMPDAARSRRRARAHATPGAAAHHPREGRAATATRVPDLAIRTTVHRRAFPARPTRSSRRCFEFLEEIRFERVGVFTYSPQEGTRGAELEDDVPESLKRERLERLYELQRAITRRAVRAVPRARHAVLVQRVDRRRLRRGARALAGR